MKGASLKIISKLEDKHFSHIPANQACSSLRQLMLHDCRHFGLFLVTLGYKITHL